MCVCVCVCMCVFRKDLFPFYFEAFIFSRNTCSRLKQYTEVTPDRTVNRMSLLQRINVNFFKHITLTCHFITIASPSTDISLEENLKLYDASYGLPSKDMVTRFKAAFKEVIYKIFYYGNVYQVRF